MKGIQDQTGRLHGDAFEREGDNYQYFLQFAPDGYAFGINALLYSMTH